MFTTGMCKLSEIETAVNICRENGNNNIIVLQCTSIYPAPAYLSNLRAMHTIRNCFDVIVGYSDHTLGDHLACASVALGAKVIEKHYTLSRTFEGPDHSFAIEPNELRSMVNKIKDVEAGMGNGLKNGPAPEEMEFFQNARRSLQAAREIHKGKVIAEEDIIIKRPGYGIHPSLINLVIGRQAKQDIQSDEPITWEML